MKTRIHFAAYWFLCALALFVPPDIRAQNDTLQAYEVELVIFRVNHPTGSPENWAVEEGASKASMRDGEEEPPPPQTTTPNPSDSNTNTSASASSSPGTSPGPGPGPGPGPSPDTNSTAKPAADAVFQPLAATQLRMNAVEESLRKSKNYQPLAHFGWSQTGFPIGNSPTFSLQDLLPGFLPDGIKLSGQASLARGRYLHLLLDLTYQAPDGQRYLLREERRMRSKEKHYFDHPYFGVIALVTPKE